MSIWCPLEDTWERESELVCMEDTYWLVGIRIRRNSRQSARLGRDSLKKCWRRQAAYFKDHLISEPRAYYRVGEHVKPDVWFDATQVIHLKIYFVLGMGSQGSRLFPKSCLSSCMEYGRGG